MERIETELKRKLKTSNNVSYPDFESMWSSIQQDEMKIPDIESMPVHTSKRKRYVMIVGLSVALMATPVYAALTSDWSNILTHRAGIQAALEQNLGQTIEQSITKNGVTLTVHTAFIDENRTFLLYSLKPDSTWDGKDVTFERIGIKDGEGNIMESHYRNEWNEELGLYEGYFETDWVVDGKTEEVEFVIDNIQVTEEGSQFIDYDPNNPKTQVFPIQKDGIDTLTIQTFEQPDNLVLLRSNITFTDSEMKSYWAGIQAIDDMYQPIQAETNGYYPNDFFGEYYSDQLFKLDTLRAEGTKFQLAYHHRKLEKVTGTWNLNLALSKKQMEMASFKEVLNIPLDDVIDNGTVINEMTVTPTQIRLNLSNKGKYRTFPYREFQLDVGGTLLKGGLGTFGSNHLELRFEMAGIDAASLTNQPITLILKDHFDEFAGDDNPIHLTDISEEPQSVTSDITGIPITWTYFMKDHDLYVESLSSDPMFGGVNQTYYLQGGEKNYGRPTRLLDGLNKNIDMYENFDKTELDIYISNYTIDKPTDEYRIQLKNGK